VIEENTTMVGEEVAGLEPVPRTDSVVAAYSDKLFTQQNYEFSTEKARHRYAESQKSKQQIDNASKDEQINFNNFGIPESSEAAVTVDFNEGEQSTLSLISDDIPTMQGESPRTYIGDTPNINLEGAKEKKPWMEKSFNVLPEGMQKIAYPALEPFENNPVVRGITIGLGDAAQGVADVARDIHNALHPDYQFEEEEWLKIPEILASNPDSTTEGVVRGLTQFMSIFYGLGGFRSATQLGSRGKQIWNDLRAGGLADATFKPEEANLSTLLNELDVVQEGSKLGALTEWLGTPVGEDADAYERLEQRAKNLLEGAGIGGAIWTLMGLLRGFKPWLQNSDPELVPNVIKKFSLPDPRINLFAGETAAYPPSGIDEAREIIGSLNLPYAEGQAIEKTGWHKLPDGNMAFEIDDSKAVFNDLEDTNNWLKIQSEKGTKDPQSGVFIKEVGLGQWLTSIDLGELIDHTELFVQYPHLAGSVVNFKSGITNMRGKVVDAGGAGGSFNPLTGSITLVVDPDVGLTKESMSSLLHEIQHSIQNTENWMNGGNTSATFLIDFKAILYEDINPLGAAKFEHKTKSAALSYSYDLDQANYWDDFSKRDSVTGTAKYIYNNPMMSNHRKEIYDLFGPPPKRYKKAEHNEWLKNVAALYRDKTQAIIDEKIRMASEYRDSTIARGVKLVDELTVKNKTKSIERQLDKLRSKNNEYRRIKNLIDKINRATTKEKRVEFYEQLQGEVQARNTQKRMNMSAKERVETTPQKTQDVPNSDQSYKRSVWGGT